MWRIYLISIINTLIITLFILQDIKKYNLNGEAKDSKDKDGDNQYTKKFDCIEDKVSYDV